MASILYKKTLQETRARGKPQQVKKWLRSPHNKFKQSKCRLENESERSHDDTKVFGVLCLYSPKNARIALFGILVFISLSCCYCTQNKLQSLAEVNQETKMLRNMTSTRPTTEEEEVSIVRSQHANNNQTTAIRSLSTAITKSATLVVTSTQSSKPNFISKLDSTTVSPSPVKSDSSRNIHRKPRLFKLRAAPMNGKLSGPIFRLELADAIERPATTLALTGSSSALPATSEQFGARTASVKIAQQHMQVGRPTQTPREPKLIRADQMLVGTNTSDPRPPSKQAHGTKSVVNMTRVKQIQLPSDRQEASVSASSPMLRLTTIPTQAPSALATAAVDKAAHSNPNGTQPFSGGSIQANSAADEAAAHPDNNEQSIFSLIDEYDSKIITNRTNAQLSCDSGEMVLRLNFSDPFKGIVYPERNRLSPCRFFGDGHNNYELRLPLRGCGTRQAAPRVFVNDVIVRFHRSLELEEDEVKTIICRYPPPLAPNSTIVDGAYLPTASSDHRGTTAATIITTTTMDGGSNEQDSAQFEFVDTATNGSQNSKNPPGGLSGSIGTLSENIIVAPNGQQQQPVNSDYTDRLAPIKQQPDMLNQRNSALLDPFIGNNQLGGDRLASIATDNEQHQHDSGRFPFISGLSGIELLFLISTLMFLVLLALGLTASYYCFRRHSNRHSTQRASAILKRKRRYISPANLLSAHQAAATSNMQQLYYTTTSGQQFRQQPASSPDSDLSARSLLNASGGHYGPSLSRYALNHGFMPETGPKSIPPLGGNSRYLAAPTIAHNSVQSHKQNQQVIGRRGEVNYAQTGYLQTTHYPASPQRHLISQFSPQSRGILPSHTPSNRTKHFHHWPVYLNAQGLDRASKEKGAEHASHVHSLSRAKSLSSVNYETHHHHHQQQQQQLWTATGTRRLGQPATLGRAGKPSRWISNDAGRNATIRCSNRQIDHHHQSKRNDSIDAHDNKAFEIREKLDKYRELELEMNNNTEMSYSATTKQHKPKILLKSIEDSYITNVTEIYEQEYTKRDSMRPLDMEEWRTKQPSKKLDKNNYRRHGSITNSIDSDDDDDLLPPPPPPPLSSAPDQHPSEHHIRNNNDEDNKVDEDCYLSGANANLRSLTEIDVNFARSLLAGPTLAQPNTDLLLRPAVSADHLAYTGYASPPLNSIAMSSRGLSKRATSVPEIVIKRDNETGKIKRQSSASESPDLILSPEYDCSRLELIKPKSGSSHNSVSYV